MNMMTMLITLAKFVLIRKEEGKIEATNAIDQLFTEHGHLSCRQDGACITKHASRTT